MKDDVKADPGRRRAWPLIELHLATLLTAPAGAVAKQVGLDVLAVVASRCLIAMPLLLIFAWRLSGQAKRAALSSKLRWALLGSGAILGIHWVCFFQGIRVSSVAVGMIAAFTFPVITAVVEPIVFRERMRRRTLVAASVVMVGVALLALEPSQGGNTLLGIGFGLTASTLFVARNLVSRRAVEVVGGVRAMAVQVAVAGVLLAPFLARLDALPTGPQWVGLLYLGIVPTAITHTLFIRSFKHFSIATASVITTLQLGYGPVYAWLVMDEVPGWPVLVGGTIVLGAVAWESVASARDRR